MSDRPLIDWDKPQDDISAVSLELRQVLRDPCSMILLDSLAADHYSAASISARYRAKRDRAQQAREARSVKLARF